MRSFSKHIYAALMGVALLSSCSRPVAYFQPTQRENFKTAQTEVTPAAAPVEVAQTEVAPAAESVATPAPVPAEQIAQAKIAMNKVEAYVRNDSKLASNKKLTKRMERVNELLASASQKQAVSTNTNAPAQKMSFAQRVMVKKINNDIKDKMMGKKAMAKSVLTIGAIIAIVGLILILLNVGFIGVLALIVGLVLILLDLLNVV